MEDRVRYLSDTWSLKSEQKVAARGIYSAQTFSWDLPSPALPRRRRMLSLYTTFPISGPLRAILATRCPVKARHPSISSLNKPCNKMCFLHACLYGHVFLHIFKPSVFSVLIPLKVSLWEVHRNAVSHVQQEERLLQESFHERHHPHSSSRVWGAICYLIMSDRKGMYASGSIDVEVLFPNLSWFRRLA